MITGCLSFVLWVMGDCWRILSNISDKVTFLS